MKNGNEKNPASLLETVFSEIATIRMTGVPILNPALRVEAVGFRTWEGRWVGVLVTPWTISLVLLPGQEAGMEALVPDQRKVWAFPSGDYEFMGLNEPSLGVCHLCPLISPVLEFATHAAAVEVAHEVMRVLLDGSGAGSNEALGDMIEEARLKGDSLAGKTVSRRDFLRLPLSERP